MARLGTLYENTAARNFRAAIRPSLVGQLKYIEPVIAVEAANALALWMVELVQATISDSKLKDERGEVTKQLRAGVRIYGRNSLANLRSQIVAYPWLMAHEFGAKGITPKNGSKYLAIPIFDALRPDGSVKFRSPRSWNRYGSFVYTQKSTGRKFLAYKDNGGKGKLRILYILVESVDIPKRLRVNQIANEMLGQLMSVWGQIYLAEATKPQYKIFDLWDGAYR